MLTIALNYGIVNSGDIMITYNEFAKLFVGISNDDFCIEINFCVGDKEEYQNCWMGKNKKDKMKKNEGQKRIYIHLDKQTKNNT